MPASFVLVYVHYVCATWDRLPLISPELEPKIHACIAAECQRVGAEPLQIGGTGDHVHALVQVHSTVSVAQLARGMKGGSSHFATHELAQDGFKWQGSYGAFSVSPDHLDRVRRYLLRQKEHHAEQRLEPDWERCTETSD